MKNNFGKKLIIIRIIPIKYFIFMNTKKMTRTPTISLMKEEMNMNPMKIGRKRIQKKYMKD